MLKAEEVEAREERIRERVRALPDALRKRFHEAADARLKDPDTYAVLNWLFVAGLHHFYLGKWLRGALNLAVFLAGLALVIAGWWLTGVVVVLLISAAELWALFRAQVIARDWNNAEMERILAELGAG